MGGWKQKEESSLLVPSTFLFLYQLSRLHKTVQVAQAHTVQVS